MAIKWTTNLMIRLFKQWTKALSLPRDGAGAFGCAFSSPIGSPDCPSVKAMLRDREFLRHLKYAIVCRGAAIGWSITVEGRNLPRSPRPENIHNSRCHEARIAVPL